MINLSLMKELTQEAYTGYMEDIFGDLKHGDTFFFLNTAYTHTFICSQTLGTIIGISQVWSEMLFCKPAVENSEGIYP